MFLILLLAKSIHKQNNYRYFRAQLEKFMFFPIWAKISVFG